jgi:TPR repeat protein
MTRAAKLGDAAAQYKLGVQQHLACRENRRGTVSGARIEALKWVRLSAAQGYRGAASACEFVALPMTREEVAEGGRRVAAFVAG